MHSVSTLFNDISGLTLIIVGVTFILLLSFIINQWGKLSSKR